MSLSGKPIAGEVLRLSRWHTAAAVAVLFLAVALGGEGVALIAVAARLPRGDTRFAYASGVLVLLLAGGLVAVGCHLLTRKPSLVLGRDRLQFCVGKHVGWQVRYRDIADLALVTPEHPLGFRMPWASSLGIRLSDPGALDAAYPGLARYRRRCGFDFAVPLKFAFEPPERCLEAVLRCYHLFKAGQQPLP
jgi:hypothetical protein